MCRSSPDRGRSWRTCRRSRSAGHPDTGSSSPPFRFRRNTRKRGRTRFGCGRNEPPRDSGRIMKAAELLVYCLENEGARFAFGIPGEENLELMDALRGSVVRFVLTRHEGAAACMADVYDSLSGRAGGCRAKLGPG